MFPPEMYTEIYFCRSVVNIGVSEPQGTQWKLGREMIQTRHAPRIFQLLALYEFCI